MKLWKVTKKVPDYFNSRIILIGNFLGTKDQVASYLLNQETVEPFRLEEVDLSFTNVSEFNPVCRVELDENGFANITRLNQEDVDRIVSLQASGLAKLTDDEKVALNL